MKHNQMTLVEYFLTLKSSLYTANQFRPTAAALRSWGIL